MENNKPMYGVWLPGKGWLRGTNKKPYADYIKDVAIELAKRIDPKAKVYFIDPAIVDLENELLNAEANQNVPLFQRIHKLLKV